MARPRYRSRTDPETAAPPQNQEDTGTTAARTERTTGPESAPATGSATGPASEAYTRGAADARRDAGTTGTTGSAGTAGTVEADERPPESPPDESPPESPAALPGRSWLAVLRRTVREYQDDKLSDWAAALTYYGVLSIFPALLALVSLLGVFGSSATKPLLDNVSQLAPGPARQILTSVLQQLQNGQGRAGLAFVIGIAVAMWSASGYIAAFMRASNSVYDIGEGRPIWKTLPLRLGLTATLVVLMAVVAVGVVFTGTLADRAGKVLGIGHSAVTAWNIAKWPVLLILVSLIFALLYWAAPNVKQPGFKWITPGSVLAVVLWLAASALFGLYVANFSNYGKTYGSIAGMVVFLVWLWISNIAVLLGLEFNAELERGRAIADGLPPEEEPYVEPRDTRKLDT